PGWTINGSLSKYLVDISLIDGSNGGTTQLMAIPSTLRSRYPDSESRFRIRMPCSSDVRSRTVVSLQDLMSFPAFRSPTTVFVVTISSASRVSLFCNMFDFLRRKTARFRSLFRQEVRHNDRDRRLSLPRFGFLV